MGFLSFSAEGLRFLGQGFNGYGAGARACQHGRVYLGIP